MARLRGEIARLESKVQSLTSWPTSTVNRTSNTAAAHAPIGGADRPCAALRRSWGDAVRRYRRLEKAQRPAGHHAGDEALIRCPRCWSARARGDVSRGLGGDEFALYWNMRRGDCGETATRMVERIAACEFSTRARHIRVSVAIGGRLIAARTTGGDHGSRRRGDVQEKVRSGLAAFSQIITVRGR